MESSARGSQMVLLKWETEVLNLLLSVDTCHLCLSNFYWLLVFEILNVSLLDRATNVAIYFNVFRFSNTKLMGK